jgi:DNA-binding MarR family transcriptional regulator
MTAKVFFDLREQMDQYSVGFPSTESGVDIEIVKKLFTEDEAEMYLNLSMMLETPQDVAKRLGRDTAQVSQLLEKMFEKGVAKTTTGIKNVVVSGAEKLTADLPQSVKIITENLDKSAKI